MNFVLGCREDFKAFLREVRRQNKNTLSGLSLDTIAQQVKGIIEGKEKKAASRGNTGASAKGKGVVSKGRPVENKIRPIENKARPDSRPTDNKGRPDSRPVDKKVKVCECVARAHS